MYFFLSSIKCKWDYICKYIFAYIPSWLHKVYSFISFVNKAKNIHICQNPCNFHLRDHTNTHTTHCIFQVCILTSALYQCTIWCLPLLPLYFLFQKKPSNNHTCLQVKNSKKFLFKIFIGYKGLCFCYTQNELVFFSWVLNEEFYKK